MEDRDWAGLTVLMDQCWKGDMTAERASSYRLFLDEFSAEEVMGALRQLVERGSPYLPAVPEIVALIRAAGEDPVPSWAEVYDYLVRALNLAAGYWSESGEEKTRRTAAWLEENAHPTVARFVEAKTFNYLSRLELNDPDYGGIRRAELEREWDAFRGVAKLRLERDRALPPGNRRGLRSLGESALLEGLPPPGVPELPSGT